ncbi:MAG: hypothetical protein AB7S38_07505 [Vulcanimicrobiota bacterium]
MGRRLSLRQASEQLGVHKNRLWRAIKSGQLRAELQERGGRSTYKVDDDELARWAGEFLSSGEFETVRAESKRGETVPLEVHLALQQQVDGLIEELRRAERRLVAVQLAFATEQQVLAETQQALFEARSHLDSDPAPILAQELKAARTELARWEKQRRSQTWWSTILRA